MRIILKLLLTVMVLVMLSLTGGCGCGFDCNSDDEDNPAFLTLGLSDSLPEDLDKVVIEVDSITFRRSGGSQVVVDSFTFETDDEEFVDADTFELDLLLYQGVKQQEIIKGLEMPTGTYDEVLIKVLVGNVNLSFVELPNGQQRAITVENGVLTLPGIRLSSGTNRFVVEFGLAQALQYLSETETYRLSNTGVRIENTDTAATIRGNVDTALFDTDTPCREKSDPESGNRIYLYAGNDLAVANLADVFTSASTEPVPANAIAPFAVASLVEDSFGGGWEYSVGYVPAGDYTLAFACNTATDDSVNFNELIIPQPTNQVHEISLSQGDAVVCDLAENRSC